MVRVVHADDLGLTGRDAETFDALPTPEGEFPLGKTLGLWEQWVRELEPGGLWVADELEAACSARDSLDDLMAELPETIAAPVFDFVDAIDRTFRGWTVESTYFADRKTDARWWWGRVPLRSRPRLFLFDLWPPDRDRNQ